MSPMARAVGPPPSRVGNVQRISDMMTTRRPLALTGTLGHRVSPLAPAGSVDGLATAVDRPVEVDGGGDLTLRAPAPAAAPTADAAAAVQREAPVTTSATPSLPAISEARLPQPPPARALHEPLPLPGRDVGAENPPRPLAVVQRQPAASTSPSVPAASSSSATADAGTAPDTDAPVGGTPLRPVSAPEPAAGDSDDAPSGVQTGDGTVVDLPLASTAAAATSASTPMENVMPPIQPRAIQRRAAEAAGASARPETAADAPLPPLPDWARPAQPTAEDTAGPSPSPSMPLQHPTVQRDAAPSAAPAGATASAAAADEAEDADDNSGANDASRSVAATAPPAAGGTGASTDAADDTSAPLVGDAAPLAATGANTELASDVAGDPGEAGDDLDLPLHAPAPSSPAAAGTAAGEGPAPDTWNAPSERLPSDRAPEPEPVDGEPAIQRMADDGAGTTASSVPLLGDRPLPLFGQPSSETGTVIGAAVTTASTRTGEALPLAPDGSSTGGPALATPPAPSAPSALAAPSRPAPSAASTAGGRPVAGVQREPLAGGTSPARAAGNTTASSGGVALPLRALPSVPERPAASPGAGGPLTDPLPVTPPAGAPPIPAMDAPLAMHAIPSMGAASMPVAAAGATATATLPDIATSAALATPVQTQRAPGATTAARPSTSTAPSRHAAPMPLQAPVQRSVDTSSAAGPSHQAGMGAPGASPSIGDLAIASGLAVRQPDGSVLFTRQEPPPSSDGAPIQRAVEVAPPNGSAVQRAVTVDLDGNGGGPGGGKNDDVPAATMPDLDLLARRLLPRFRRLLASEARTGRGRLGESPWNRH